MAEHSKDFPPSGAWPICPSWENDGQTSEAANEGTKRHALLEIWMRWRVNLASDKGLWTWPTSVEADYDDGLGPQPLPVTGDDVRAVQTLVPYLDKHPAVTGYGKPGHMVWVEELIDYGKAFGRPGQGFFGHSDIILMTPNELEVFDAKFGHKIKEPLNPQNKMYALGAGGIIYSDSWVGQAQQVRKVKLTIGQPTNTRGPIQSWEGSIDAMVQWRNEVLEWVRARELGRGQTFNPTDDACHFCLHRNNCAGRMRAMAQMLDGATSPSIPPSGGSMHQTPADPWAALSPAPEPRQEPLQPQLDLPSLSPAEQITTLAETHAGREVKDINSEELSKLLGVAGQLKAFLKDLEDEAKRRLLDGKAIPGWKMIAGKRSRKAKISDEEMIHLFRDTWKVPKTDIVDADGNVTRVGVFTIKLKSLTQLEKVASELSPARQKKFAETWEMVPGNPVLAPETDPAPAVNPRPELLDGADDVKEEVNPGNALTPGQAAQGSTPMKEEEPKPDWY